AAVPKQHLQRSIGHVLAHSRQGCGPKKRARALVSGAAEIGHLDPHAAKPMPLVSRSESSTEMPGAALRGARGTLRAHPPRRFSAEPPEQNTGSTRRKPRVCRARMPYLGMATSPGGNLTNR